MDKPLLQTSQTHSLETPLHWTNPGCLSLGMLAEFYCSTAQPQRIGCEHHNGEEGHRFVWKSDAHGCPNSTDLFHYSNPNAIWDLYHIIPYYTPFSDTNVWGPCKLQRQVMQTDPPMVNICMRSRAFVWHGMSQLCPREERKTVENCSTLKPSKPIEWNGGSVHFPSPPLRHSIPGRRVISSWDMNYETCTWVDAAAKRLNRWHWWY